jgi:hypothetical protein
MKMARFLLAFVVLTCCLTTAARAEDLHETWLKYMVGKWKFTLGEIQGEQTTEAAPGVQAVVFRAVGTQGFAIMGVIGWDSDRKMLVETDFSVGNGRSVRHYSEITKEAVRGVHESWSNGSGTLGDIEYRRVSDNEMELEGTFRGGQKLTVKFERITDR